MVRGIIWVNSVLIFKLITSSLNTNVFRLIDNSPFSSFIFQKDANFFLSIDPDTPSSFWDEYGVITTIISAFIALIFGAILRPVLEEVVKRGIKKIKGLTSDFKSRYLRKTIEELRILNIRGVKTMVPVRPELENVYVTLRTRSRGEKLSEGHTLTIGAKLFLHTRIAIIGDAGCGKSTLLSYIALSFARGLQRERLGVEKELLPVYIPIRNLSRTLLKDQNSPLGLGGYLDNFYNYLGMDPPEDFFESNLRDGKCIVLFDGLDEVGDDANRLFVSEWIDQQVAIYPKNFYICSSRIEGYGNSELTNDFVVYVIQPFNDEDIKEFCNNWYYAIELVTRGEDNNVTRENARDNARNLIEAIDKHQSIKKLAFNPLMSSIIALVHSYRGKLPQRRVELYNECLNVLLGHWDEAKGLLVELRPSQKIAVLRPIAVAMHEANRRVITHETLLNWLKAQLPKVGGDSNDAEQFIEEIKVRSGVLLESELNEYAFSHQSFQEYLVALDYVKTKKENQLLSHSEEPWWNEVIQLYAGMMDASSIIVGLLDHGSTDQLILAGKCLIDAEQVEVPVRARTIQELRRGFSEADIGGYLSIGKILASLAGKDTLEYFFQIAVTDDENHDRAVQAMVQMAQQPFNEERKNVQDRLIAYYSMGICEAISSKIPTNKIKKAALEVLHWTDDSFVIEFLSKERSSDSMVTIPVGSFVFGEGKSHKEITLPTYFISKNLVTNADYSNFLNEGGYWEQSFWPQKGWQEKELREWTQPEYWNDKDFNDPEQPVVGISWYEAVAYCNWLSSKTNFPYRLPSEYEWEKAARGTDGQKFPWGNAWDINRCNTKERKIGKTTKVGVFSPMGDSPYGITDMAGNVWEWCNNLYSDLNDDQSNQVTNTEDVGKRTERGGSWNFHYIVSKSTFRDRDDPTVRVSDKGFRCCILY